MKTTNKTNRNQVTMTTIHTEEKKGRGIMKQMRFGKKALALATAAALTIGGMAPAASADAASFTDWTSHFLHFEEDEDSMSVVGADTNYNSVDTGDMQQTEAEFDAASLRINREPAGDSEATSEEDRRCPGNREEAQPTAEVTQAPVVHTARPTVTPTATARPVPASTVQPIVVSTTQPTPVSTAAPSGRLSVERTSIEAEAGMESEEEELDDDTDIELSRPQIKAVKYFKAKKIKLSFKKIDVQADGYEVRYSKFSSMLMSKTVSNEGDGSCTLRNLKKRQSYYAQIRVYKEVDGEKVYSEWSMKKKVYIRK